MPTSHPSTHSAEVHADHRLGVIAAGVAVTAWGLTGTLIKSVEMDALAIAFWRFGIFAAALVAWGVARGGGRRLLTVMRSTLPAGVLMAGDVLLFFTAVKHTAVVNATTIGALQPLVIAGVAAKFFGERIRSREVLAAAIAIAGVVTIVAQSAGTPEWSGGGDLAAVGALLCWSGYFVVAKRWNTNVSPVEFTTGSGAWTALIALPIGLVVGHEMGPPPSSEWLPLITLLVLGGVFGHMLMNWAIPRVALWLSSTMTLLIPVIASVAAWIWLDEPLTRWQLVAMGVVVASLAVIVTSQTPVPSTPLDDPEPAAADVAP